MTPGVAQTAELCWHSGDGPAGSGTKAKKCGGRYIGKIGGFMNDGPSIENNMTDQWMEYLFTHKPVSNVPHLVEWTDSYEDCLRGRLRSKLLRELEHINSIINR
jgi:hypothetical protein